MNAPARLGDSLRAAREKQGHTLSEAAEATRIKTQVLERMEANDFSRIAAPIYAKGFLRLYAEYLKLDPEPLIRDYLEKHARVVRPTLATQAPRPAAAAAAAPPAAARPVAPAPATVPAEPSGKSDRSDKSDKSDAPVQASPPAPRPAPPTVPRPALSPVRQEPTPAAVLAAELRAQAGRLADALAAGVSAAVQAGLSAARRLRWPSGAPSLRGARRYGAHRPALRWEYAAAVAAVLLIVGLLGWALTRGRARPEPPRQAAPPTPAAVARPDTLRLAVEPPPPYLPSAPRKGR